MDLEFSNKKNNNKKYKHRKTFHHFFLTCILYKNKEKIISLRKTLKKKIRESWSQIS